MAIAMISVMEDKIQTQREVGTKLQSVAKKLFEIHSY